MHQKPASRPGQAGFRVSERLQLAQPRFTQPAPQAQQTLVAELQRASDELDRLLAEVGLGTRDQRAFDDFEERAQRISQRILTAFRGADARPSRLLKQNADGSCWF